MSDTKVEQYIITEEESLKLQMLALKAEKARAVVEKSVAELNLANERFTAYRNSLGGKYSEYGRYELVPESLDINTRTGKRRLKKAEDPDFEITSKAKK